MPFSKDDEHTLPNQLLNLGLLVSWLSGCYSYVKLYQSCSHMFRVDFGVRQGFLLSADLFAIYMDDLAQLGQFIRGMFIILCVFYHSDYCFVHFPLFFKIQ